MADNILGTSLQTLGTLTHLKVSKDSDTQTAPAGLNSSEKQMADMINLSSSARALIEKNRKVDSYLQIFKSALQIINGMTPRIAPAQIYKADVEYFKPKTHSTFTTKI